MKGPLPQHYSIVHSAIILPDIDIKAVQSSIGGIANPSLQIAFSGVTYLMKYS